MKEYKECRNPVLPPDIHIPDPEAHVMPDGRVYVYGSWDQEENIFCSKQYRVFSSDNMVDWVDHGISFDSSKVPWIFDEDAPKYPGFNWSKPTPFLKKLYELAAINEKEEVSKTPDDILFAPDAIHKNGKYYLYFCMANDSEGVAIADKPEGPFNNPIQLPCGGIDPAVLIDDDGQSYFYWGQFYAKGAKLKENMVEFEEGTIVNNLVTEEEHYFHEGSSLRKRGDTYYFVYSSMVRGKPTSLAYATSKSPLGPFEYKGVIIDNDGCDPQSWNNHGSVEEVNGQWYVFYHRSSRNSPQKRRLCIEPIIFSEDGGILEVPMTSQGAGKPFGIHETIEAFRACQLSGSVYIAPSKNNGEVLTGMRDGDEAIYRYVEWKRPVNYISIEGTGSGEIKIYLNDEENASGSVILKNGKMTSSSFQRSYGKHEIKLKFNKVNDLEIHSFSFK
ncbi:xylosidase [Bacillus sp. AFS076308]|uniref:family 43 glycosylhydrolase n=1 Tax=unclassified Bacillus (in: firmicutes) TaxID=185979 RepID=UPI000BF5DAB4|nr:MULTISPECIES: family 43 glycosylhydrolase [unclassified Bacillus (in: firmicutes)]PFO07767.1 xylosidase [Bacillus sp. AFS076308]PGV51450.1 xylosidase [Bacillus sp. AFS037270]